MSIILSRITIGTMVVSLEDAFEIIYEFGNRPAVFTPAKTGAATGGINNPVVYAFFLLSVCF